MKVVQKIVMLGMFATLMNSGVYGSTLGGGTVAGSGAAVPVAGATSSTVASTSAVGQYSALPQDPVSNQQYHQPVTIGTPYDEFCGYNAYIGSPRRVSETLALLCAWPKHACLKTAYAYFQFFKSPIRSLKRRRAAEAVYASQNGNSQNRQALFSDLFEYRAEYTTRGILKDSLVPDILPSLEAQCFDQKQNFIDTYCAPDPVSRKPNEYCKNDLVQMACGLFYGPRANPCGNGGFLRTYAPAKSAMRGLIYKTCTPDGSVGAVGLVNKTIDPTNKTCKDTFEYGSAGVVQAQQ